ncbi:MAG TPA: ABC transporter ATP-binding protein [Sphingobium sp.]
MATHSATRLLDIAELSIDLSSPAGPLRALDSVGLTVESGETVCLVGESGSGKTLTALSVMRLIESMGGTIAGGSIHLGRHDLVTLSERQMGALRGRRIGMVFQDPMTAFDPLFTIGTQIGEVIEKHMRLSRKAARARTIELLERVHISDAHARVDQYPHELSGGMRQRAMIAMALACDPLLLIADEPTTALDVTIQAQILRLLKELQAQNGMAILLITHDLGLATSIADRVVVLYAGRIVERGPVKQVFGQPAHPYTQGLLRSVDTGAVPAGEPLPSIGGSIPGLADQPPGCRFHPRCERATAHCLLTQPPLERRGEGEVACWHPGSGPTVPPRTLARIVPAATVQRKIAGEGEAEPLLRIEGLVKHYPGAARGLLGRRGAPVRAVDGVDLSIQPGETFGLVGESGSGKSTLGRLALNLEAPSRGRVVLGGRDLATLNRGALRTARRDMQMIFQDPYGSIDARWTIERIVEEPLKVHGVGDVSARRERVAELLDLVGLDRGFAGRYPHQLSGGQRQRVAIARAVALEPRFIVADEAVSALDVSVRAQVINLMMDIKARLGLTYLFIGHDLHIVRHVSDRIGVLYLGKLVEVGPADEVFRAPVHPYTRALIAAIPRIDVHNRAAPTPLEGEIPSPSALPRGCRFHTRCPLVHARCRIEEPELRLVQERHGVACHLAE